LPQGSFPGFKEKRAQCPSLKMGGLLLYEGAPRTGKRALADKNRRGEVVGFLEGKLRGWVFVHPRALSRD